jgi:hypothetical protein
MTAAERSPDVWTGHHISQAHKLEFYSIRLLVVSVIGFFLILISVIQRCIKHSRWRRGDPLYSDLSFYDQIHYSLGFWHLIHLIAEFIVAGAAIYLLIEAGVMTQFLSVNVLRYYSIAVLVSLTVGCRWLSISPGLYQVVLVMRVSFVRLVSLTIGIIPL